MTIETDPVEIENFAFLKLRAAPDGSERRQARALCAIPRAYANNHRSVLMPHRVKVIYRFKVTRNFLLNGFSHFFLLTVDKFLHLHCFFRDAIEPINASDV